MSENKTDVDFMLLLHLACKACYYMHMNACLQVVMRKNIIVEAPKPSSPQVSVLVPHRGGDPWGACVYTEKQNARYLFTYMFNMKLLY